jgi:hypothetical protein
VAERQLPKLNVAGSIPVSRSNKISSLQFRTSIYAPLVLQLHHQERFLQLVNCRKPAFARRLCENVVADIEAVTELIGNQLAVPASFVLIAHCLDRYP